MPNMKPNDEPAAATFHLFPFLPAELRLHIWALSCTPRVVTVHYSPSQDLCTTSTPPPTLFSICHESRSEGQRLYSSLFGTHTHPQGRIPFRAAQDVLYVPRGRGETGYGEAAREFAALARGAAVRRLALDHVAPEIRRPWETYNKLCLLRAFPALDSAYLVVDGTRTPDGGEVVELVDPREYDAALVRVMEDVRDSFRYEVDTPVTWTSERRAEGEGWDVARRRDVPASGVSLVLKTKACRPMLSHRSPSMACV